MSETYKVIDGKRIETPTTTYTPDILYCGDRIIHESGGGFVLIEDVADILNEETAPLHETIAKQAAEIAALHARLNSINNEAYDALHSLHYGVIEKSELQRVFSIIHTESKIKKEIE